MMPGRLLSHLTSAHLTSADLAMSATTSGAAGWAVSLFSHGLLGPLVSFVLFVVTTWWRARTQRNTPALLTPAQVGQLITELSTQGLLAGGREGVTTHQDPEGRSESEVTHGSGR
jgi:hypothetical protein